MVDQEGRSHGSPQRDGTIGGDIWKTEDAEAQVNPEGKEGQNESDGGGADEQIHG